MAIRSYDNILVTGLTQSYGGSADSDGLGTWNTNYDLGSIATIPAGATAAIFRYDVITGGWVGMRTPGKTAKETHSDHASAQGYIMWVPLGAGNTVDLYIESNTGQKIYLIGVTDARWTFTDIDGPRETQSMTSGYAVKTLSNAPNGAVAALVRGSTLLSWRPTGSAAGYVAGNGRAVVKLDGSKQVEVRSSGADTLTMFGYCTGGCNFNSTQFDTSETFTADSAWHTASTLGASGKQMVQLLKGITNDDTFGSSFRKTGATYNPNSTVPTYAEYQMVPLSAGGQFDYWIETGATTTTWYQLVTFDPFYGTAPTITSVNGGSALYPGQANVAVTGTNLDLIIGVRLVDSEGTEVDVTSSWETFP